MSQPTTRGDGTTSAPGVSVVLAWHEALNGGDLERLVELSHPDVEAGGPRGGDRGSQLLRDWALRSGIRLVPVRVFDRAETVFVVRDGLVTSVLRYPDLKEALPVANLDGSHEVPAGHLARTRRSREEFGRP